jgi:hypothetical protein
VLLYEDIGVGQLAIASCAKSRSGLRHTGETKGIGHAEGRLE